MNILIELPTWLGDSIMATPSIEELIKLYPKAKITFFGSYLSCEALKSHPNALHVKIDESKKSFFRLYWLFKKAKKLGEFDLAISFKSSVISTFFLRFISAKKRFQYSKYLYKGHQVQKYSNFLKKALHVKINPQSLCLHVKPYIYKRPTLGINPGATYGSAKRWYPKEFAKVADYFSKTYDIVIFGGPNETDIANEVESLIEAKNVINLAGKTTISELISKIAGLSLFVTNDSGPMHVAAAYKVPTVTLFGPTKHDETSQWKNPNGYIITHNLECAPCMKRVCPIKTHECMKSIKANEVIDIINKKIT